jgi:choline kinase
MHAIIPAAGLGTRLRPCTEGTPKCLLPVGGHPILQRTLRRLHAAGVEGVTCVVGYRADLIRDFLAGLPGGPAVELVYNPEYASTNNIVSLLLTAHRWRGDVVVIDSDVLLSQSLVDRVVHGGGDALAVDTGRARHEIDMAVELREGRVWHLDKRLPAERTSGEFFGLSHWTESGGAELLDTVRRMISTGDRDTWYPYAIRALAKSRPISVVATTTDHWIEIDTPSDLRTARLGIERGARWAA